MFKPLSILLTATVILTSCSSEDDAGDINPVLEIPQDYTFNREGNSTVSFNGQTTRIKMSEEIVSSFTDFDNATEASIMAQFAHTAGNADFSDADLNASDKNVRSKVAASVDYYNTNAVESQAIKSTFDDYISKQVSEVFPNQNTLAVAGTAGQIADGTRTRYVSAQGLEYNQAFAKGLLGALMTDQILNNYLSVTVLDEGENRANNSAGITAEGSSYTTMEHKWDEAYGYLYGASQDPANPNATIGEDDKFLNEYIGRVNDDADFNTTAETIFEAFKTGRAAIVAADYMTRDAQAAIIRAEVSKVIAVRGIYYLQQAKTKIEDGNQTGAFHGLSEAYGFIYSLQFTRNPQTDAPYLSATEVTALLDQLMGDGANGFWDLTPETIDAVSESIASAFDFTVAQAASID
ncbi:MULTISPECIES: DUF4856 domain-containing protein [unclassified Leeuwenhoekiella]|uniref:DUF4856 domain-containing protein n=1 Tax=unclassified Leeuwenhoekiella TaxID=2615029 RepID=UPI000C43A6B2|nr:MULTISPECIES: DUF4856 domain-containing protein [unclassified Leeuwenhoekiella]MAW95127.1 DUF4856 domain-containing protein [Leeuwenhoekiella sp.]MBA79847.1 DUF4856 domain-containing protein [Leeuwenhoekiella sp.]|tara:strand:- start:1986 stop:3206 length:1221 start_codon:yes stop_codon:yes gene_type:complete